MVNTYPADRTRRILLAIIGVLSATSATVQAQSAADTPPVLATAMTATTLDIQVFTVNPAMRFAAVLPPQDPGVERSIQPPALDDAARNETFRNLGKAGEGTPSMDGVHAAPEAELDYFVLSPTTMAVSGKAYLTFALPYELDPEHGVKFDINFPGSASVNLNVEKGRTYLVDFAVNSWRSGSYEIETAAGSQEFIDSNGDLEHVLVGISAAGSGWTAVRIKRTGTGYYLHSVEVTQAGETQAGETQEVTQDEQLN